MAGRVCNKHEEYVHEGAVCPWCEPPTQAKAEPPPTTMPPAFERAHADAGFLGYCLPATQAPSLRGFDVPAGAPIVHLSPCDMALPKEVSDALRGIFRGGRDSPVLPTDWPARGE